MTEFGVTPTNPARFRGEVVSDQIFLLDTRTIKMSQQPDDVKIFITHGSPGA